MIKLILIIILTINLFSYNDFYKVMQEPKQTKIKSKTVNYKGFNIEYIFKYKIKARVISAKKYSWDILSNIVTHDIGVTWGNLSKTNVFNEITWNQENRFLIYQFPKRIIKKLGGINYIKSHIANIHLIPKNWVIESKLNKIKPYDIIEIEGYLVDLRYKNFIVKTSISRTDEGPGACEVIMVSNIKILHSRTKSLFYENKQKKIDTSTLDFKTPGKGTRSYNN